MAACVVRQSLSHHAALALVRVPGEAAADQLVAEMDEERVERIDFAVRADTLDFAGDVCRNSKPVTSFWHSCPILWPAKC